MDWSTVAGAVLGSGFVAGIVSSIAKYLSDRKLESFKSELRLDNDRQLTQLKSDLERTNTTELERLKTNLKLVETIQAKQLAAYEALSTLLWHSDVLLTSARSFHIFYVFRLPDDMLDNFRMMCAGLDNWLVSNEMYMAENLYKEVTELRHMLWHQTQMLGPGVHQTQEDQSWRHGVGHRTIELKENAARIRTAIRDQVQHLTTVPQ
jgi:hypothetical protein